MIADLRRKDLILLVADKNMEASLKGLLLRSQALGLRRMIFDLYVHPERDPGCLLRAHDFLRPFVTRYERALVVLDHAGVAAKPPSAPYWSLSSRSGLVRQVGRIGRPLS